MIIFVTVLILLFIFIIFCFKAKLLWVGTDNKRIVLSSQGKLSNFINQISYNNKYSVGLLSFSSKQDEKDLKFFEEKGSNGKSIFYCGWSKNNIFGLKIYNLKEYYNVDELLSKYKSEEEIERRINETSVACLTKMYNDNLNFSEFEIESLKNIELLQNNNENIFLFK